MAEAIILPIAKSIMFKIASFTADLASSHVAEEIQAAKSAKEDLIVIAHVLTAISAVLHDAEKKQYTNDSMKVWLRDLKSLVYDIDDLLDEVAFDGLQRRVNDCHFRRQLRYYFSSSNPLISSFRWSHKIRDLRKQLELIVKMKEDFNLTKEPVEYLVDDIMNPFDGIAYVHVPDIVGRDDDKQNILNKLTNVNDNRNLHALPIVGMGGIGKTALAKLVYQDVQFYDLKLWVCVSKEFHKTKIIEDILKSGGVELGDNTPNHRLYNPLIEKLHSLLNGKRFLLVLDDVCVEDFTVWQELKNLLDVGNPGSVILITTRSLEVASMIETISSYNLKSLSEDVCWSIFKKLAFKDDEEDKYQKLNEIGQSIVKKCCGIPLVVKTLASLLRSVRDEQEWQRINDMESFIELDQHYDNVIQLLRLSYDKLPSHLKACFAYMSLYGKNVKLSSNSVPYLWSALGLLPVEKKNENICLLGYSYFTELESKIIIDEDKDLDSHVDGVLSHCKMHDLLHDLAVKIMGEELCFVTLDKMTGLDFARHIVWGYESFGRLKDKEFPKELLKAKKARTFRFGYQMNQHISRSFLEGIISNFSCLRILEFGNLWFEELPKSIGNLKHLRHLNMSGNPIITSLPDTICNLLNLETFLIHECEKLEMLPRDLSQLQNLKKFMVTTCLQMSLIGIKLIELSSLQFLSFHSCHGLTSLWENDNAGYLTSLQSLHIYNCPNLTSLPNSMMGLVNLQYLLITNCTGLQRLRLMWIENLKLTSLPNGIQSAAKSLEYLIIKNCGSLVELPEWFDHFIRLRTIIIINCPKLLGLPKSFCQPSSPKQLFIKDCPYL